MVAHVVISLIENEETGEKREMVAAIVPEEFMAWAVVLAIGADKARVVPYEGDVHVTDVNIVPLTFTFEGVPIGRKPVASR